MGLLNRLFGVQPKAEERSGPTWSISDPALAEWLGVSGLGATLVSEDSALQIPAYWRAVSLIAGTIAGLPLKTYRDTADGRQRVRSWLDDPGAPYGMPAFQWKEMVMGHLLTRGESFLLHAYDGAGRIVGAWPAHPSTVTVRWDPAGYGRKIFSVLMADGEMREYGPEDMTQVMGLTLDGFRGLSPLTLFRRTVRLGLSLEIAAERAAANGFLIGGLVTTADDVTEDELARIKKSLTQKAAGPENAGDIAAVNRDLKFTPWAMTAEDAEFLASRDFEITEFARMFGIPPHLLGQTEKQTSFGAGLKEQNLGLSKYTLKPWTDRLEDVFIRLLPGARFAEFDFKEFLKGAPEDEVNLLIAEVRGGVMTANEARKILGLPPIDGGDVLLVPAPGSANGPH